VRFIDEHRHDMIDDREFGVEPICGVLSEGGRRNAPSTYYAARPWRGLDAVELATLEWVDWYNNRRLFSTIGNIPPAEAETNHYLTSAPSVILQMGNPSLH
jgi:transposase InsO family protein